MISHGLCSANIFFSINIMYQKTNSRRLNLLKGFVNIYPTLIFSWFITRILNISAPPSLNFVREVLITPNKLIIQPFNRIAAILINFIVGIYCILIYTQVAHGPNKIKNRNPLINPTQRLIRHGLIIPLVLLFIQPNRIYYLISSKH